MQNHFKNFCKGFIIGLANIIPGVSGGTIALLTGIFERLINSIKSFDLQAIHYLLKFNVKKFCQYTDILFLATVLGGALTGIFTLASLLKYLFEFYPILVWSFFLGLILSSVYSIAQKIDKWNFMIYGLCLISTLVSFFISTQLEPSAENGSFLYLLLCGIIAACSMILPGLSGSFILILLGNYELVMINAVRNFNIAILFPVAAGAGLGIIAFSHFLSWILKKFRNQTLAILIGFILGSLTILWPWKKAITRTFSGGKLKIIGYQWLFPDSFDCDFWFAIILMIIGAISLFYLEKKVLKK